MFVTVDRINRRKYRILKEYGAEVTTVSLDKIIIDKAINQEIGDLTSFEFCLKVTKGID